MSGKAVENAKEIFESRLREIKISETLPTVWNEIITVPHEALIELISDETESVCGFKPTAETVGTIIDGLQKNVIPSIAPQINDVPASKSRGINIYNGKIIVSFTLFGERYGVRTWKEMYLKFCQILSNKRPRDFENILNLRGTKRQYFAKNPNEILGAVEKVGNTEIYAEVNLGSNAIVKNSLNLLKLFGYGENELSIEYRSSLVNNSNSTIFPLI